MSDVKKKFRDFFADLEKRGRADKFEMVREEEIQEFIHDFPSIKLPTAYIEFMRYAGHGQYWIGSDYSLKRVKHLQESARALLDENDFPHKLREEDFVFYMHQGYIFCFFNLNEGDNPQVYYYDEGEDMDDFVKCGDGFFDAVTGNSYPLGLTLIKR